jgi:serine/threonine-protein kinase
MAREGDQIGPYTLIKKLGKGGCGEVWLSKRRTKIATTEVALKIPLEENIDWDMFKREAEIWVQVTGHPNILSIIEADVLAWSSDGEITAKEQIVIASEYAPDGSLDDWLEQRGGKASTAKEALEIIDSILAGLAHLHARNIIHRDLKPENILFQSGIPRLSDFGISSILKSSSIYYGTSSGTLFYMPPEAFDGKFSTQSDLWAVGVILYIEVTQLG